VGAEEQVAQTPSPQQLQQQQQEQRQRGHARQPREALP
jgi:hypothetical protein